MRMAALGGPTWETGGVGPPPGMAHLFEIMLGERPQLHLLKLGRRSLPWLEWAKPTWSSAVALPWAKKIVFFLSQDVFLFCFSVGFLVSFWISILDLFLFCFFICCSCFLFFCFGVLLFFDFWRPITKTLLEKLETPKTPKMKNA